MVGSGLQIFRAFPSFGAKIPQKDLLNWPKSFAIGGWLGGALQWHLTLHVDLHRDRTGLSRLSAFQRKLPAGLVHAQATFPESGRWCGTISSSGRSRALREAYNPLQKHAYTSAIGLGVLSVLTGLAVWKPVQFSWLAWLMGGFHWAAVVALPHHVGDSGFCVGPSGDGGAAWLEQFRVDADGLEEGSRVLTGRQIRMAEPDIAFNNPAPAGTTAEQDLIARVQRGQNELFYELVRPYERRVYAAALAILRNEADAEDVAQEAMLKAFANIRQFRAESRFSTWLIQITVNEALMRRRRERTVVMEGIDDRRDEDSSYTPRDFADWREIPSEALERKEVRQRLAEALGVARSQIPGSVRAARHGTVEHSGNGRGAGDLRRLGEDAVAAGAADAARSARSRMGAGLVQPAAVREGKQAMVNREAMNCEQVWREISNYVDGEVEAGLRSTMDEHFRGCEKCKSVLEGTQNVIRLYGDERMMEAPAGLWTATGEKTGPECARQQQALAHVVNLVDSSDGGVASGGRIAGCQFVDDRESVEVRARAAGAGHSPGHAGGGFRGRQDFPRGRMRLHSQQGQGTNPHG